LRQPELLEHPSLRGYKLSRDLSPTRHEQHVARTFALSYDRLDPINPTDAQAQALLARAAHFAPGQPTPRDLLLATITRAAQDSDDALQAEDALRRLLDLGLLEPEALDTVRLHRLLAAFVQTVARDTVAQTAVEDVLLAAAERLLDAGYSGPLLALHPHLRALTESMQPRDEARTAHLETVLGKSLYVVGDYVGAQPLEHNPPLSMPSRSRSGYWAPSIPTSPSASAIWLHSIRRRGAMRRPRLCTDAPSPSGSTR
jgi:hypothetical protein